ncbi:hypothetical protein [Achromobacter pestifer]|uniref:Uncharacterized protein n=1 Tax=Achromobacter pestifer TaxID=1353889 RepID=A0A6S6YU56_9BURK|nr:hypothetical protein [Achromobacter pestifer]CAB3642877.1 hypothetical protein LMG3431_02271 [Achromobacter pestifer]
MPPTAIKWLSSIAFGLLVGRTAFSVFNPLLIIAFGLNAPQTGAYTPSDSATVDTMQMVGGIISLLITVAVTAALVRIPNMRRLVGWGCTLLGISLLLTIPANLLLMDPAAHDAATVGARAASDTNTALFFWVLIFGLPYMGGGLVLTIAGIILIRKNPKQVATGSPLG